MASGSFSFCGVDIKDLGLEYAPEMENTYVYRPTETSTHIETYEGHNGGYAYGIWKQPKDFTLRCIFEDIYIDRGLMSQIYSLFRVGRSGKLVFSKRPWCYYYATVTEPVEENFTNYKNGIITIRLKAMYPFARSEIVTNTRTEKYHTSLMQNSAVFDELNMEPDLEYHITSKNTTIYLANPGTERAALGFEISGNVGSGVTISNATTEQSCRMVAISKAATTNVNKKVVVDPISGKTTLVGGNNKELAFLYHEYGFLELEPSFPAVRDIFVTYNGTNTLSTRNNINKDYRHQYIFVKDNWYEIAAQPSRRQIQISQAVSGSGAHKTMIIPMNKITVKADDTIDIQIKFIFKPTYS